MVSPPAYAGGRGGVFPPNRRKETAFSTPALWDFLKMSKVEKLALQSFGKFDIVNVKQRLKRRRGG